MLFSTTHYARTRLFFPVLSLLLATPAMGQNLLTNAGCESGTSDPPTSWTEDDSQDDWLCVVDGHIGIPAADGGFYLLQNGTVSSDVFNTLRQRVDVSSEASFIDGGGVEVNFSAKYRDDTVNSPDVLRFGLRFYNASQVSVNGGSTDWTTANITGNATGTYQSSITNDIAVPATTRYIEAVIECTDNDNSDYCDYTFDTFHLEFDATSLPVELTAFEAVADAGAAVLTWVTASETNNAGFELQHAQTEASWQPLGFIEGHGTTAETRRYQYRTEALMPGVHRFRLKQVDFDGAFEYSPVVELAVEAPTSALLSAPAPNPFNPQTQFSLAVPVAQDVQVAVYDLLGQRVAVLHQGPMAAGTTEVLTFEASALPSGVYLIRAEGATFQATRTVTLQK